MGTYRFNGGLIWQSNRFMENKYFDIHVEGEVDQVIELSEKSLLVPALVDFHCHVWAPGASSVGVTAIEYLSSGVAACGDAGTFGYDGWVNADRLWRNSPIEVRSWLSVLPEGLTIHPNPNPTKPENISLERLLELVPQADDRLLGYKVRLGQVDEKTDRGLLHLARKAAEQSGLKVMVHITDSFLKIEEVVSILRPGDILTHPYHGNRGNILNDQGKVSQEFIDAVEAGLLLDVGQGSKHFSWRTFHKAMAEGIKPHTISTDIVRKTWKKAPVNDMSYVLSRFIAAGITIDEAAASMLTTALNLMGVEIDNRKNLVVLEANQSPVQYADSHGETISSNISYSPVFHVLNGKSVYVSEELSKVNQTL